MKKRKTNINISLYSVSVLEEESNNFMIQNARNIADYGTE